MQREAELNISGWSEEIHVGVFEKLQDVKVWERGEEGEEAGEQDRRQVVKGLFFWAEGVSFMFKSELNWKEMCDFSAKIPFDFSWLFLIERISLLF